jgi:Ca2+-binding RTX toxin-like protein
LQAALLPDRSSLTISATATNALEVITARLAGTGATHLTIVAHGESGAIYLGAEPLTIEHFERRSQLLAEWGVAEISLFVCEVGADSAFVAGLTRLTGAKVAAAGGKVGAAALGGSWALDNAVTPVFAIDRLKDYTGVLATFAGTAGDDEAKANAGVIVGFTGGTLAELQDGVGDTFNAGAGNDTIVAGNGNDTLNGNAGEDTLNPSLGIDTVNGGTDTDTLIVDYSGNDNPNGIQGIVTDIFDLVNGNGRFYAYTNGNADFDQVTYTSIEKFNITGTKYNDDIRGGNNNDILIGGNGDDTLSGFQGIDTLFMPIQMAMPTSTKLPTPALRSSTSLELNITMIFAAVTIAIL